MNTHNYVYINDHVYKPGRGVAKIDPISPFYIVFDRIKEGKGVGKKKKKVWNKVVRKKGVENRKKEKKGGGGSKERRREGGRKNEGWGQRGGGGGEKRRKDKNSLEIAAALGFACYFQLMFRILSVVS